MKYIKQSLTKFVVATVVMIVTAIAASQQLYLFVVFRNVDGLLDSQGGRYHLWLAAGAILLAAIAACLMFLFFMGRGRSQRHEALLSPLVPRHALINVNPNARSLTGDHFSVISWAQQNQWSVEGQADDRRPMNGGVGVSPGSASAQRSATRLTHQVMYRKWARERHD
jgi:hypothetical protein